MIKKTDINIQQYSRWKWKEQTSHNTAKLETASLKLSISDDIY